MANGYVDTSLTRTLPASIEAENAVLGSILVSPESIERVTSIIKPEDFRNEDNGKIFSAMLEMFTASRTIDTVTLVDTLVQTGRYSEENSINFIKVIAQSVPSAANIIDYANIVKEKSTLRKIIVACNEIMEEAYSEQTPSDKVLDFAGDKIFDIANSRKSGDFRHVRDIIQNVYTELETLSGNKNAISGVRTGFSDLDRVLVQMGKGDLVLVGARPAMGKTSFALNIATNVAKSLKGSKSVCVFSLEMSGEQLVTRMLASEALVDSYAMRSGEIPSDAWPRLASAASRISGTDIYIDDTSGLSVTEMKSKLRHVTNLGLVVVDYLGLMQSGKRLENRVQEVGEITRSLKIMAKDLGIPIICCAQLSRGPEGRNDKRPMLSDLRESGSIEQDADIVMFLYRDEYYAKQDSKEEQEANTAEVIVAKNRHGSVGTIKVGWMKEYTKFRSLEQMEAPDQ